MKKEMQKKGMKEKILPTKFFDIEPINFLFN